MPEETGNMNPWFLQLVLSLQSAAMYQMGKTMSPISGKIERDMDQARISIDLLTMLQEKTKDNLTEEESRLLNSMVYNLQMNYVEELNRDKEAKATAETGDATPDAEKSEEPEGDGGEADKDTDS